MLVSQTADFVIASPDKGCVVFAADNYGTKKKIVVIMVRPPVRCSKFLESGSRQLVYINLSQSVRDPLSTYAQYVTYILLFFYCEYQKEK